MSRGTTITSIFCALLTLGTAFAILSLSARILIPQTEISAEHGNGSTTGVSLRKVDHVYSVRYFVTAARDDRKFELLYLDIDRQTGQLREFALRIKSGAEVGTFFADFEELEYDGIPVSR